MRWQKLLSRYGLVFAGSYILVFVLLVTFYSRFEFPTFFGDILIGRGDFVLYLPFASSLAGAAFITVMYEAYKLFKSV